MAKSARRSSDDPMEEIVAEYRDRLPVYDEFATACKVLVEQLLPLDDIRVHSVTCRPKEVDRLRDKLARPEKHYARLAEVTDLAGVRIITYLGDEVDAVATIIEREFKIILEQSIDKRQALDPDRFGYLSLHYICSLPAKRTRLPEYAPHKGLLCEIQVRSILQHAWAEIEHDLGYTAPEAIPRTIRRRFSRMAALLETADEEFMRIRDELTEYAAEVEKDIVEKPSEVLLDKISLTAFIEQDVIVRRMDKQMVDYVGGVIEDADDRWLNNLVAYLQSLGIQGIEELKTALAKRERVVLQQFKIRLKDQHRETVRRGISLLHLWQVRVVETGGNDALTVAFEKFGFGPPEVGEDGEPTIMAAVQHALKAEGKPR